MTARLAITEAALIGLMAMASAVGCTRLDAQDREALVAKGRALFAEKGCYMRLATILVPVDGSALAEAALPRALELAEASGARVLLLRAAHASSLPGADPTEAQVKVVEEAEAYLARLRERLARPGGVKVETSVWYGPAAYAIVEAARLHKVDEIVMTTHGRSGLGRLLLGSVAESVLHDTTTPILLLRAEGAPPQTPSSSDREAA